jgi:hypothetical protein
MAHHGEELGVDLYKLWVVGQVRLPAGAQVYAEANHNLANIGYLESIFRRDAHFTGDSYGPVLVPWTELHDTLQAILADASENMDLSGQALCEAVQYYANSDADAKKKLDSTRDQNESTITVDPTDPVYPEGIYSKPI